MKSTARHYCVLIAEIEVTGEDVDLCMRVLSALDSGGLGDTVIVEYRDAGERKILAAAPHSRVIAETPLPAAHN